MKKTPSWLHYAIEALTAILIASIAFAYMSVGCYDLPVILGSIGAIATIAVYDIRKREDK